MRNLDNFPVMAWDGKNSALRARAQVMHREPLILEMGSNFGINVDVGDCGCSSVDNGKNFLGCDPKCTLSLLAETNHQPLLVQVGEAAMDSGMLVNLDKTRSRIIFYD